jgi:holin-like protein
MNALRGMGYLLVFQALGELLSRSLGLPFPGPVVGMVLLLPVLRWHVVRDPVAACADYLLSHLSLLFVPVGVGVIRHLSIVSDYGGRIAVVLLFSTLIGLAVTVLALDRLWRRDDTSGL